MPGTNSHQLAPDEGWIIDPSIVIELQPGKVVESLRFPLLSISPCLEVYNSFRDHTKYLACEIKGYFHTIGGQFFHDNESTFNWVSVGTILNLRSLTRVLAFRTNYSQKLDQIAYDYKYVRQAYRTFVAVYCFRCGRLQTFRSTDRFELEEISLAHQNCIGKPHIIRFDDLATVTFQTRKELDNE